MRCQDFVPNFAWDQQKVHIGVRLGFQWHNSLWAEVAAADREKQILGMEEDVDRGKFVQ